MLSHIVDQMLNPNADLESTFKSVLCAQCSETAGNNTISCMFSCNQCSGQLTKFVNSVKEVVSIPNNVNEDAALLVTHEMRLEAVNALVSCYNVMKQFHESALSAQEWLEQDRNHETSAHSKEDAMVQSTKPSDDDVAFMVTNKNKEIGMLNYELSKCKEEIGRLKNLSTPHRSMLSNSSDESIDAFLQPDNSLLLYSTHPVVRLSESQEESFAKFETRMDAELKVESLKEIIRLKAALEGWYY